MAVYTKLSKAQISKLLTQFQINFQPSFTFKGIATGTVNTYYRIQFINGPSYYLKIDEVGDQKRLLNELSVFKWLEQKKTKLPFLTPRPIPTKNNQFYIPFKNKFALLFTEVTGTEIDPLQNKHLKKAGQALAHLHKIKPAPQIKSHRFNLTGLKKTFKSILPQLKKEHPHLAQQISKAFSELKTPKTLKQSVVHADLFPENILWNKNKLSGIIDYEAAGLDSPLFDICVGLHALCFPKQKFSKVKANAFLSGYESVRKITKSEQKAFDSYFKLTTLRFLITRLKDFELVNASPQAPNFKNYKEYVKRLEQIQTISLF